MQFAEGPIEGIALKGFEETVAAYAAIEEARGENSPLSAVGLALSSEIERQGDSPDASSPVFEGEDALLIIQALEKIAEQGTSNYQPTARKMLAEMSASIQRNPWEQAMKPAKPVEHRISEPAASQLPKRRAPHSVNGEIVDGHVELIGFGQLVTALRAIEDFSGESNPQTIAGLKDAIDKAENFELNGAVYWGEAAHVIYRALWQAAARREKPHDVSAAYMLDTNLGNTERSVVSANEALVSVSN